MEKCICIKDGYMTSGAQFCIKGEAYNYYNKLDDEYLVDTMINNRHIMYGKFFHEYYIECNSFSMKYVNDMDFESGEI